LFGILNTNTQEETAMYTKECLGLAEARVAVEAALNEANKKPEEPVAVAVVDDQGKLVFFARMDGCPPVVVELALMKAYTAGVALMDTVSFAARDKEWGRELSTYGDDRFTYLQGGLVIWSSPRPDGAKQVLLGGIGISGRMSDEDERLARIGLEAMQAQP
jgi:glc operon protein GlcG